MNQLKVHLHQTIAALHEQGWSKRKIARELALDRATVRKYLAALAAKPPTPLPGSAEAGGSKPPTPLPGSQEVPAAKSPPHPHPGSAAPKPDPASLWDPGREPIQKALQAGLSVQRIYQDLVSEHQFTGSYHAVRRFVRRGQSATDLPFRRMKCAPGQALQVDFGQGACVIENGHRRKTHLFRGVLSHSRKGYSEAVWRPTTESFIRCLENAFRHYGGVALTVVIDNLKAGVIQADWFDPDLNPKLEDFARDYGTVILPTQPAMPRHKGKVEAGVKDAQNNAVKGRRFESLSAQNLFLAEWERNVADTRLHGTARQPAGQVFADVEKPALRPLPASLFPVFVEAPRTVHRDGHIEFQRAYDSVPPE